MRTIIDGRKAGFCKLVVDRKSARILGCHIVGERAGEIAQVAAIAISAGMRVDDLAHVPLAFPTYTGNIAYAAADAARQLDLDVTWRSNKVAQVRTDTGTTLTGISGASGEAHSPSMVGADPSTGPRGIASL
jgi:Pyridine nucleotide-disulphide oxidoreductase, dimerisation domain